MKMSKPHLVVFLILFVLGMSCFSNSLKNPLLHWDDHVYIKNNSYIRNISLETLKLLFTKPFFKNYAPLHILSYWPDYLLWDTRPEGYRFINILLHIFNGFLVFLIIGNLYDNNKGALLGAILFLIHPIQVESVVWLSQRKTVLASFFFFLALYTHIIYRKRNTLFPYVLCMAFFLLAALTKPITITFPLILVLYDWGFKNIRPQKSWKTILPFLIISFFSALTTIWAQGIDTGIKHYLGNNFFISLFITGKIITSYLWKVLFPLQLSARYVFTFQGMANLFTFSSLFSWVVILLLIICLFKLFCKNPSLAFPFLWFIILLLPVLNLIPTSTQMADRYLYLPLAGFSMMASILSSHFIFRNQHNKKKLFKIFNISFIGITILFYASLTIARNRVWRNDQTLWEDAIKQDPNNYYAITYLGNVYFIRALKGKNKIHNLTKASELFQKALKTKATFAPSLLGMATVCMEKGDYHEAIPVLLKARKYNDEKRQSVRIEYNLGVAYLKINQIKNAQDSFITVLTMDSSFIPAYLALGNLFYYQKKRGEAQAYYQSVIELSPDDPRGYFHLALVKEKFQNFSSAINNYYKALQFLSSSEITSFTSADIHLNLGGLFYQSRNYPKAIEHYQKMLLLAPANPQAGKVKTILKELLQMR